MLQTLLLEKMILNNKKFLEEEIPNEKMLSLMNSKLDFNVNELPYLWMPVIYQFLFEDEKMFWDKEIIQLTYNKILEIQLSINDQEKFNRVLAESLEHFFLSLSSYNDIVKNIKLNNEFKIAPQTELRMFYIPVYNSLVEGCWTNLLKFWRNLLNLVDDKDLLPQTKLNSLVELVSSRGLGEIIQNIDIDVRNAINHGGIYIIDEKTVVFQYSKGREGVQTKEIKSYALRRKILNLIDAASSTYLGVLKFFSKSNIDLNFLTPYLQNTDIYDSLIKLEISSYHKSCLYTYRSQDVNNNNQLNLTFYTDEMSQNKKLEFSTFLFSKLYLHYRDFNIDRFFINFNSERCLPSFISAESKDIKMFFTRELESLGDLAEKILKNNTAMLCEPFLEEINVNDAKKGFYSDIKEKKYEITNISDVSTESMKRFKATIYIETASRKNHIKVIVNQVIDKLKRLKNNPQLKYKTKYGEMPADSIILTIYKIKGREGRREKHLISSNENFIATVQYYSDIEYKLAHTELKEKFWNDLKFRTEGNVEYGWNPNF